MFNAKNKDTQTTSLTSFMSLLTASNIFLTFLQCFYCSLRTSKCQPGFTFIFIASQLILFWYLCIFVVNFEHIQKDTQHIQLKCLFITQNVYLPQRRYFIPTKRQWLFINLIFRKFLRGTSLLDAIKQLVQRTFTNESSYIVD